MADFKQTNYYDFVKGYNIFNADLINEDNLNKGINRVKRELNNVWSMLMILQDKPVFKWQTNISYLPGEIVYYTPNDNPTIDEIKSSYYRATDLPDNYARVPATNSLYWEKISKVSVIPDFSEETYVKYTGNRDWTPTLPADPINLKFLRDFVELQLNTELKKFIPYDNKKNYPITEKYHVTTKEYVDSEIDKLKKGTVNNADYLINYPGNDFVRTDSKNKLIARGSDHNFIRTTTQGFLPGSSSSVIGSTTDTFREIHAKDFIGTATRAKYADLAEYYASDRDYSPGTVLAVGGSEEVTEFKREMVYAGVVSENPGFILNNNSEKCKTLVALKGRVRVKISEPVKKSYYLYADNNGKALGSRTRLDPNIFEFIGVALEDSSEDSVLAKI